MGKVKQNSPVNAINTAQQMESISKQMNMLSRSVEDLSNQQRIHMPVYPPNAPNQNAYSNYRTNRPDYRNMPSQRNFQYRGGNPRFNQQNQAPAQFQRNQPRQQENFRQPVQSLAELGAEPEMIAMCRNWFMEEGYFVNVTIENVPVAFLIDTGLTPPVSLMLGRQLRLPTDLTFGIPETRPSTFKTAYAYQLEKHRTQTHKD